MEQQIKFKHFRNLQTIGRGWSFGHVPSNFGGVTMAYIELTYPDGTIHLLAGFGACSIEDNFSRDKGRSVAVDRLVQQPVTINNFDREELLQENELYMVDHLLRDPMKLQGLRVENCL
jgi:hypothetical protein